MVLKDGIPQLIRVHDLHYVDFNYTVNAPPNSDIAIAQTPLFGDPEILVTTDPRRARIDHWDWEAILTDMVFVNHTHPKYVNPGTYNIAAYGLEVSLFSMTAAPEINSSE